MMKVGFPDNPNCKTRSMFENNYMVSLNDDVLSASQKYGFDLIELHFQLLEEIALEGEEFSKIKSYTDRVRDNGLYVMMHSPFLTKNFQFLWLVKPRNFSDARELKENELENILDLAGKLNIERLTFHATKPGVFLNDSEFRRFENRLESLVQYLDNKDYQTKISIETGGLRKEQLLRISENPGLYITFDFAHYALDTNNSSKQIVDFFKEIQDSVYQIHLCQTKKGEDLHMPIYKPGFIENSSFLQYLGSLDRDFYILLETHANKRNVDFTRQHLSL